MNLFIFSCQDDAYLIENIMFVYDIAVCMTVFLQTT